MGNYKPHIIVSLIWVIIWAALYVIDFYYENFLDILYAIVSNLVFFGLYLMSIIIAHELINNKQKQ